MAAARVAAPVLALLASLMAAPAQAAEPAVSLTLSQRWENAAVLGAWTPYTATVRNAGNTDFTGDLLLIPNETVQRVASATWPAYRERLTVQKGTEKAFTIYVVESPGNYRAELHDLAGRLVGTADLQPGASSGYTVAVLSDQRQADARIAAYKPMGQNKIAFTSFSSPAAFPTNAVYLSGLNAVVIDDFDSAALSQAQVQALKDFVGLGGSLVVTGGPSWRRTMLPLPAELAPLHPTASAIASLQPLAELAAAASSQSAQVASGELHGQVLLGSHDGPPLVVAAYYGAGEVIDLAYDPLAEPFASLEPALGTMAWSQGLSSALVEHRVNGRGYGPDLTAQAGVGGAQAAGTTKVATAVAAPNAPVPAGGVQAGVDQIYDVLKDTPVAAVPPIGLLGGILLGYVLLVGPLNYLLLRGVRRRELLWVTVPAVSLLFTMGAYAVGFGSRGTDFVDNEVQVQQLGPDGALRTQAYYGIYSPHKGDYWVTFPANTLVSTALSVGDYSITSSDNAMIDVGARPRVQIQGAAIWSLRPAQSLTLSHQTVAIDAHLRLASGRLVGSVANRGQRALGTIWAVNGVGAVAELGPGIGPGQSLQVDQTMGSVISSAGQSSPPTPARGPASNGTYASPADPQPSDSLSPDAKRLAVLKVAAGAAVTGDPYAITLVALSEPSGGIQVDGGHLTRYAVAAVLVPARLEAVDSFAQASPAPRLVATFQSSLTEFVDVYDLEVPPGHQSPLDLSYTVASAVQTSTAIKPAVRALDVYDWSTGTWRSLPQPVGQTSQVSTRDALRAGEVQSGLVRVRAHEAAAGNSASYLKLAERPLPISSGPPG